jgi:ribosomal protein L34E
MPKCPKCGGEMHDVSKVRSQRISSTKVEKYQVKGVQCSKCGHLRLIKRFPLQKKESKEIVTQSSESILSQ